MSGTISENVRVETIEQRSNLAGLIILAHFNGRFVGVQPAAFAIDPATIGAITPEQLAEALLGKQDLTARGVSSGYAPLGADGVVPAQHLPTLAGGGAPLTGMNPANLAPSAGPGTAVEAARADHVHRFPSATDVGAAPASHTHAIAAIIGLAEALTGVERITERGKPSGYAPLDDNGLVPGANLPPGISQTALDAKADTADVNTALEGKVNTSDLTAALSAKADSNDARIVNAIQPNSLSMGESFSTAYVFAATDRNKIKTCTSIADLTVTLNSQPFGTVARFVQGAAGKMTFIAATGVEVNSLGNFKISAGKEANIIVTVIAENRWNISGDLI